MSDYLIIPLTQGCVAWVSPEDYPALASSKWRAKRAGSRLYAVRWAPRAAGTPKRHLWMHRFILNAPAGLEVDHREHHPNPKIVDNRRSNLRLATCQQNQGNRSKSLRPSSSPFKGVSWHRRDRRWRAQIKIHGTRVSLGEFTSEAHAALAYDLAAVKHFGSFALTNFPVPGAERWLFGAEA